MVEKNVGDVSDFFDCIFCSSYVYTDMGVGGDCYECRNKESPYWSKFDKERWRGICLMPGQEQKGCDEHSLKKILR